ncbi:Bug family tripartite tricarboxylate transporter substrate binding protein [Piscinibacter koreensis]|uniref:Tripartite tricarboxylate transporter substrate binding protein n=1 Tax=Piscinibacter koreensis TaxID=2742824 RepID=A0A7Y6TYC1_9BURK|nr:tripartite tricarboxylate transporter substrate binding protein [Schlegelella koreensis]NUZ07941.1 tripartite tricarboxylate transporter substrate binding protein [Schlegelella koreensis]
MIRRRLFATLLLAGLGASSLSALAQDPAASYPSKPIRIIVNFPPGGTVDTLARIVGQKLNDKFGQPVIVDNRAGAGGNIGAQAVAVAEPDGYTLLASPPGPLTINENLYKSLPFDPSRLTPVIMLASVPNAVTARADFPANSLKDLIAYVKANPGKVSYGSQGNGSTSHLTGQMFASMIGGDMLHVPFKGEGPALNELLSGRIDLFFGNVSAVLKFQQAKQVKLLALASPQRGSMAPDVPSATEGGLPDFIASAWFALAAPPGTPASMARKLNAAVAEAMKSPEVIQKFAQQGAEVVGGSPADMAKFLLAERSRWKKVIDSAKVTLD